jgi:hypothetical protein
MPTSAFSGSIRPSPGTVHILGTITNSGNYLWYHDLGQMANGDEMELRFATSVSAAGTVSLLYEAGYAHRQATQIKATPAVPIVRTAMVNLKQTAGSPSWSYFEIIQI